MLQSIVNIKRKGKIYSKFKSRPRYIVLKATAGCVRKQYFAVGKEPPEKGLTTRTFSLLLVMYLEASLA